VVPRSTHRQAPVVGRAPAAPTRAVYPHPRAVGPAPEAIPVDGRGRPKL